ncbi:C-C chemokine receptor type 6-like [Littorina saxatilis]|uniref:C-C chemokine receptor type 6-like n=1 Tax=Littorina saxatilis TaxID=31220 RepID=UPI0038B459DD
MIDMEEFDWDSLLALNLTYSEPLEMVSESDTMDTETHKTLLTVMLVLGALSNMILALCLAHTWKYWRQVKWYIIMVSVANWMEVLFTFSVNLRWTVTGTWEGSDASCKILTFLSALGPNMAAMALGALAVHVLLTTITGCQGNRLRHALVIGLFVLLSLPLPVSKLFVNKLLEFESHFYSEAHRQCVEELGSPYERLYYYIGASIAFVYFPVFVFLYSVVAAVILIVVKGRGSTKGDENSSDVVIAGLLGVVVMVCSVPYVTLSLIKAVFNHSVTSWEVIAGLMYLDHCRNFMTATVTVIFAYVYAFRNRGEGYATPGGHKNYGGERQKLVN